MQNRKRDTDVQNFGLWEKARDISREQHRNMYII